MYVNFSDGIEGESEFKACPGWCEITELKQDFEQKASPEAEGTHDASKAKHSEVGISKNIDKASSKLMQKCWDGTTLDEVVIDCFRAAPGSAPLKYFNIILKHVIVKKFEFKSSEGEIITEDLELVATFAQYSYWPMKKDGTVGSLQRAIIDLSKNQ